MSRVGKMPVNLPAGVEVKVDDKNNVSVKGPKGSLQEKISSLLEVKINDGVLEVTREKDSKNARSQHGLARSLVQNMVVGVTDGYEKKLSLVGVGYKAEKQGNKLTLNLAFSHPIVMEDPEGISTECPTANEIIIKGANKAQVGNYAADIRALRKPEPYKGKGIRYVDEIVRRKEGKAGVKK